MATEGNFDFGEFLDEFIADDASGDEFEGFSLDDVVDNPTENFENYIDADNWTAGDREPPQLNFTKVAGMRQTVQNETSPMEYFKLFLSDPDYEFMAEQTNLYAQQYIGSSHLKPNSRHQKWHDTTKSEMKQFIALVLAMGLVRQLDVKEYWTLDPITSTPFFPSVMPRDRFLSLMAFFHLNDNLYCVPRGQEGLTRFTNLIRIYALTREWSHGGEIFISAYPDKPDKYGLKAYILCDAVNAYCLKMKLYTGKPTTPPSEKGATHDLVMDLLRNDYACGHILYCDNYYASPSSWTFGVLV
ncbi:piggyBac transposable element-derived protein 4-like [Saccostrea cucullata]|uniref:piggyBac transposable element-derived protein 4-like n=1 Tax=Saccostrea cuccullata TaxID=36930 RepID=UPI002ED11E02